MKIAYTYSLWCSTSQPQEKYDRPETMALVCECLTLAGHEVEPVDVSAPLARTIARLEAFNPDIVLNTAQGRAGKTPEAFYPALFEELGIPFIGSDSFVFARLRNREQIQSIPESLTKLCDSTSPFEKIKNMSFTAIFLEGPAFVGANERGRIGFAGAPSLDSSALQKLSTCVLGIVKTLGLRDFATIEFHVDLNGKIDFVGADPNPSLGARSIFFEGAKTLGYLDPTSVLATIVDSAAFRYGLKPHTGKRAINVKRKICVGFAYNLRRIHSSVENDIDAEAEFDSPETVGAVREAITSLGYDVVDLEANPELPSILPKSKIDVVFNIAEGIGGRARESLVPALLDLMQIPYTGSDVTSISICHDKILAKRVVSQAGINTSSYFTLASGREKTPKALQFPLIIKPAYEGSSKGIHDSSVVMNEAQLRTQASQFLSRYNQPLLVEAYLPGREFTIGLLGEKRPQVLPIMEVIFTDKGNSFPVYSFESKVKDVKVRFEVPAKIDSQLNKKLSTMARQVFAALGCRDYARMDFRLDEKGNPFFLECNPLPGLTPNFSDLVVLAAAAGFDYRMLIAEMLAPALRRMRVQQSL